MLDQALKTQLQSILHLLRSPIELALSASGSDPGADAAMLGLIEELASLSPSISASRGPAAPAGEGPSFSVGKPGQAARIRFRGLPMGHEFTSLALALLHASGHPPKISAQAAEQARRLPSGLRFTTYYSQSCHNCPEVVQALNAICALHPDAAHTAVDGAGAQAELAALGAMGVPATFLNGAPFAQGRMSIEEILAKLDQAGSAKAARSLSERGTFDALVVGGGPAGAAAAVYAARKGIRVGVLADRFGGQTLDTQGIENYISVLGTTGPQFSAALEAHALAWQAEVMKPFKASGIRRGSQGEAPFVVQVEGGGELSAKTVILAPGARWRQMGVPGEELHRGKGVAYCPHCDGPLFKGKRVAVVGGGNSGVEAAIDLAGIASEVTLLEWADSLKADAVLVRKLASLPNATVLLGVQVLEVLGDGSKASGLAYAERATGAERSLAAEGIFVQIGLVPNTEWLGGFVETSPSGEIAVDERARTSVQGVFAAGDATTTPFKQIVIAAGEGAKAALSAFDLLMRS